MSRRPNFWFPFLLFGTMMLVVLPLPLVIGSIIKMQYGPFMFLPILVLIAAYNMDGPFHNFMGSILDFGLPEIQEDEHLDEIIRVKLYAIYLL